MRPGSAGGKSLRSHTAQAPVGFMPFLNAVGEIFFKIYPKGSLLIGKIKLINDERISFQTFFAGRRKI